jgi:hypothetical protein
MFDQFFSNIIVITIECLRVGKVFRCHHQWRLMSRLPRFLRFLRFLWFLRFPWLHQNQSKRWSPSASSPDRKGQRMLSEFGQSFSMEQLFLLQGSVFFSKKVLGCQKIAKETSETSNFEYSKLSIYIIFFKCSEILKSLFKATLESLIKYNFPKS